MRGGTGEARQRAWSAKLPVAVGVVAMLVLTVGLGGWSVTARIEGAVLAPGVVAVASYRQVVQHQDGGTVAELKVREGDRVAAGQVLIRLDDVALLAERAIIVGQIREARARMARLRAERDGLDEITFPPELTQAATDAPEIAELMEGQRRLFAARRMEMQQQRAQLGEQIKQYESQIAGLTAQRDAVVAQAKLLSEELARQEELLGKGLARSSQVLALRREAARLAGNVGELDARIAQTGGLIAQTRLELVRLGNARREEVITELRDLSVKVAELQERLISLEQRLARLDIRAPVGGVVHGLAVHTIGAVVRPAEPLMNIIPDAGDLLIRIRVPPVHIDEVHVGQPVTLRFSALDRRTTPVVHGTLVRVSAVASSVKASGRSYYGGEVTLDDGEVERLGDVRLLPGMPVEAFIATGARTPLSYLVKPLADYFARAMRES